MTNAAAAPESGTLPDSGSSSPVAWAGGLSVAAALIACLVIFENGSFLAFAIHGDSLHVALQTWDYANHGYALEGFSMSRAPSIFPDLVVYGAVQLVTGSWRFASLAYGALSLLGLAVAGGFIVRTIVSSSWRTATLAFLLLTVPMLMLELPMTPASAHMHVFLPTNHGGPFILALAALGVGWSWLQRPTGGKLLSLFVLVAGGVLSDMLFLVSCVGPTIAALTIALFRRRIGARTAWPILVCLALGTIAGRALEPLLVKDGLFEIDWPTAPMRARALLASAGELATAAPLTTLLAYALPIAAFLAAPLLLRARPRQPAGLDAVEYWWVLSITSVVTTLFLTALVYEDVWHYRYMMPLLWWPIIWSTALVVRALGPARNSAVPVGLAGVATVLGFAYVAPGLHTPALLALHHPLEACLLEGQLSGGLKAGLGDYWTARYVEVSSDWRLQVDQIEPDGSAMWWSNDRFWYTHDIHDGARPPEYNYIVMTGLDEQAIKAHYGAPDRTLDCGGRAVWVYDDPAAFRSALVRNSPPLYATFLEAGEGIDRICIAPDRFFSASYPGGPGHRASLEGPLAARAEFADHRQPRTWGPAFGLPPGRWTLAVDYSLVSDAPGRDRWQVSAGWGYETLYEAPLAPTTEGRQRTAEFDLDLQRPTHGIEMRTFLAGTGSVTIHGGQIARGAWLKAEDCEK